MLSAGPVLQNSPPRPDVCRERGIDRSDSLHDRVVRNLQEIDLTVVDQDSRSAKQSFTCIANVSNKAGSKNSDTSSEYIKSDMFNAFMDAHNK